MTAEILTWILWGYLIGSLPFGYLITKLSSNENLLEIGYKKSSGSNVVKHVGMWQGVLTISLDVAKGFIVVWLVQVLGLPEWVQIASALAVVIGHNWSVFLGFEGGRGIASLMGALLAFSFPITFIAILIFAAVFVIWDASIGTLLVFPVVAYLAYYMGSFETIGLFSLLVLFPVLFKRLSPTDEISNWNLFIRRLLMDGDHKIFDFRIVRLMDRYPSAFKPVLFVIGLIKQARGFVPPVLSLSPQDVAQLLSVAAKKAAAHQEEVNRINVFPVADKDTGYNLSATTVGIENVVSKKEYKTFKSLAKDVRLTAIKSARGNAGMIYVGFLLGFFERIQKETKGIDAQTFAKALLISSTRARSAIHNPVDGTMLDVISATAQGAKNYSKEGDNIIELLENSHKEAEAALKATTEKLEVLKKNNVVDAGALGFVRILEGWIEHLRGEVPAVSVMAPVNLTAEQPPLKYRYCVQIGFQKNRGNIQKLKEELSLLGNSMEVLEAEGRVRLHIHTDNPESVKEKLSFATDLNIHIEDMRAQVAQTSIKPLGLVVGDTASLPQSFIEKNNMVEIAFIAQFPNGEKVTKDNAYQKMRQALEKGDPLPTTSQPPINILESSYKEALLRHKEVIVLTLSSELSGTYGSSRIARSMLSNKQRLTIYDTGVIDAGEGLVVWKAQELINQGKDAKEVINLLNSYAPKVQLVGIPEDISYILRSGRMTLPKPVVPVLLLAQKLGFRILLSLKDRKLKMSGIVWGNNIPALLTKELQKRKPKAKTRVVLSHADNESGLKELKEKIKQVDNIDILYTALVSTVVGVYIGPGSLIVGFAPQD